MAEALIPVDLFNPGQVFACLGFLEAADVLLGDAEGGFDWRDEGDVRFVLRAAGDENPVAAVLDFLAGAEVASLVPGAAQLDTAKWDVPTLSVVEDAPFPFPAPDSPATLPARLAMAGGAEVVIDHWGDGTDRDAVKFWAGSGGYPGAALLRDALDLVRDHLKDRRPDIATDPFSLSTPQSSSFRFDWRRDYIPLDAGFSPNRHASLTMVGYPLVEILAAIGLTHARPERLDKLTYRYAVIDAGMDPLPPILLRATLGGAAGPFARRTFRMLLGWPGQEGQARCITDVFEETPA